jgi:glutamate formiminotransferase
MEVSAVIECVPNFSEGRRREVIDAIAAAIAGVPGAVVLDIHADADHNRSVITFVGAAEAVAEAAFQAVRTAAALIDMTQHRGQHPRIGAADVVPFVPLRAATLDQCVVIARAVGRRIGEELGIPVYLYEAAATRPDRVALPDLRRGEYEGLREAIARDPARAPDFGPARLGPAGATIVGARMPLIAYNVYLNTDDVRVARRVAKAVRGSSGGLRGVRALGMLVGGRAQVSLNLIDYRATPLHRVVELVAREAAAYGAAIVESELVGLIPEDALIDAARFYLRLHRMRADQVLERRLAQVAPNAQPPATDHRPAPLAAERREPAAVDSEAEGTMDLSWRLMVEALGTAARELATAGVGEARARTMLAALGRELLDLAERPPEGSGPRAAARRLLLIAERAAKVPEVLASMTEGGDAYFKAGAASATFLAHTVAESARFRAQSLLPQLADEELRTNFEHEFDAHVRQIKELIARRNVSAS